MLDRVGGHGNSLWTKQAEEMLIELWNANRLSSSQIADYFGISRNAIMGKVFRLMKKGKVVRRQMGRRPAKAEPRHRAPYKQSSSLPRERRIVVVPRIDPPTPTKIEPSPSRYVDIVGLEQKHCREVMQLNPKPLYCGNIRRRGSSFCEFHHEKNWQAARERVR